MIFTGPVFTKFKTT